MDAPIVQVTVAVPSEEVADAVAAALLDARLAACVQVLGPVRSRYWWNGVIEAATEWLCIAKTTTSASDDAVATVRSVHPYETPEILVTPVAGGAPDYLDWVGREVRGETPAS